MSDVEKDIRQAVTRLPRNGDHRPAIVTGPHLTGSLVELLARVGQVEQGIEGLLGMIIGPNPDPARVSPLAKAEDPTEPLFPALARKIVEITRTVERIEANLKRGADVLR